MKLVPGFTTSRNASSSMLAVWLFVLASGFANACLLDAPHHGELQMTMDHLPPPAIDVGGTS